MYVIILHKKRVYCILLDLFVVNLKFDQLYVTRLASGPLQTEEATTPYQHCVRRYLVSRTTDLGFGQSLFVYERIITTQSTHPNPSERFSSPLALNNRLSRSV